MKTPRDILLEHHRAAAPKLDAIRRDVLNAGGEQAPQDSWSLHGFLWSLRWHLAGMSAIWLVIIFLNMDPGQGPRMTAAVLPVKRASPQVVLLSLRENRRQIAELIGNPTTDADKQKDFLPKPQSERRGETMMV
jgi:hypothetical protein